MCMFNIYIKLCVIIKIPSYLSLKNINSCLRYICSDDMTHPLFHTYMYIPFMHICNISVCFFLSWHNIQKHITISRLLFLIPGLYGNGRYAWHPYGNHRQVQFLYFACSRQYTIRKILWYGSILRKNPSVTQRAKKKCWCFLCWYHA